MPVLHLAVFDKVNIHVHDSELDLDTPSFDYCTAMRNSPASPPAGPIYNQDCNSSPFNSQNLVISRAEDNSQFNIKNSNEENEEDLAVAINSFDSDRKQHILG